MNVESSSSVMKDLLCLPRAEERKKRNILFSSAAVEEEETDDVYATAQIEEYKERILSFTHGVSRFQQRQHSAGYILSVSQHRCECIRDIRKYCVYVV